MDPTQERIEALGVAWQLLGANWFECETCGYMDYEQIPGEFGSWTTHYRRGVFTDECGRMYPYRLAQKRLI